MILFQELGNLFLGVLEVFLIHQADILEVLGNLSVQDAFEHFLGFAGHFRVFCHHLLLQSPFVFHNISRHIFQRDVLRIHGSNLHGHILGHFRSGACHDNQSGNGTAHVHVGAELLIVCLFNDHEAAEGNLFADGGCCVCDQFINGAFRGFQCKHFFHRFRLTCQDRGHDRVNQVQELFVLGDKVGLGVHFCNDCGVAVNGNLCQTFCSNSACFLGRLGNAFFTQPVNSFRFVAIAFCQGFLAVHHACACFFAQFLDLFCGDSHSLPP